MAVGVRAQTEVGETYRLIFRLHHGAEHHFRYRVLNALFSCLVKYLHQRGAQLVRVLGFNGVSGIQSDVVREGDEILNLFFRGLLVNTVKARQTEGF